MWGVGFAHPPRVSSVSSSNMASLNCPRRSALRHSASATAIRSASVSQQPGLGRPSWFGTLDASADRHYKHQGFDRAVHTARASCLMSGGVITTCSARSALRPLSSGQHGRG